MQVEEPIGLWTCCTASLREQLSESAWHMWLSGVEPIPGTESSHENVLVLGVPSLAIRDRVESRFVPMIEATLESLAGQAVKIRLQVLSEVPPAIPATYPTDIGMTAGDQRSSGPHGTVGDNSSVTLDSRFSFDTFVAASSNRLAYAAAQAVAETPGRSYNPLYIYGDSGLGKTHLLHAIGNYVRENFPRRKVFYVTTETFMNDFVDSLRLSTTIAFKRRYRDCDVLLIDDIQFMQNKEGLQEELFHTYNVLHGTGKQIVLTSDRPPKSIETLEDRLRSRLLSGLITEIDPPDLETRLAILRLKADSDRVDIPHDVLEFIATNVKHNIRELEGALIRVTAFASLNREPDLASPGPTGPLRHRLGRRANPHHPGDDPRGDRQPLRVHRRGHLWAQSHPATRHRSPSRDVPGQDADRVQLPGHRQGLRRPGPHDGDPRGCQDLRADGGAPPDLRPGHEPHDQDQSRDPVRGWGKPVGKHVIRSPLPVPWWLVLNNPRPVVPPDRFSMPYWSTG